MDELMTNKHTLSDRSGVNDAVRVQILTAEHSSLLLTRSITWNEMFSRATMFITILSAAIVALALVAQATNFGPNFRLFALLVLPVVFLVGFVTFIRLGEANTDDIGLVIGMNRLRNAYLELAPELQPYFTTGHFDDHASILQSYGLGYRQSFSRYLGGTPALVGMINAVVVGIIAALVADALGAPSTVDAVVGVVAALAAAAGHAALMSRAIQRGRGGYRPKFPSNRPG
jgi:ABC-type transport system involved in cytochrome bd biosynthesis fused ATPase/permease subunit